MFLLNSPSHHLSAAAARSKSKSYYKPQRTFSRSYGTILPSSFTRVLPSALVSSTRPPVSVWGTDCICLELRGFSWKSGYGYFLTVVNSSRLSDYRKKSFNPPYYLLPFTSTTIGWLTLPPPSPHRNISKYGNINPFPFDYDFHPRLRFRLTLPRLTLDRKPWSSGERAFNSFYRYLRQHSHL